MPAGGPGWLTPAWEDQLLERFPGLSRPDLRYAAHLLDDGAMPVDLIIASLEPGAGGRDEARQVLSQLRVARQQRSAGPPADASEHL